MKLTKTIVERLLIDPDSVDLDKFTFIDDIAADALADRYGPRGLHLNGLTSLSDAAADALARHEGGLSLNGLPGLSDAAAEALARQKGSLRLEGLTNLSDAAAEALTAPNIRVPGKFKLTDIRRVAACDGEPDRQFIVALNFWYCDVYYRGFRIMSRTEIVRLVKGLESGTQIGTENMPGAWHEEFDVALLADAFRIHSAREADLSDMRSLFGESVGGNDYFDAVLEAGDRATEVGDDEEDLGP